MHGHWGIESMNQNNIVNKPIPKGHAYSPVPIYIYLLHIYIYTYIQKWDLLKWWIVDPDLGIRMVIMVTPDLQERIATSIELFLAVRLFGWSKPRDPHPGKNMVLYFHIYIYIFICICVYIYIYRYRYGGFLKWRGYPTVDGLS